MHYAVCERGNGPASVNVEDAMVLKRWMAFWLPIVWIIAHDLA